MVSLGKKSGTTNFNESPLKGHIGRPQLFASSDQQEETTGLLFKDIVKMKPPGDHLQPHDAQAHPKSTTSASRQSNRADGKLYVHIFKCLKGL